MKSLLMLATAAALLGLFTAGTASASPANGQSDRTYRGTVTSVDAPDHILRVHGFLLTRNFSAGKDCKVILQDKGDVSLADLRPGQEVEVFYTDENGVLIARQIAQHNLEYRGHITAIEPDKEAILVRGGTMTREFAVPPQVAVSLHDSQVTGLGQLHLGDDVTVVYERNGGRPMVYRIEQRSARFVGAITQIDPTTRIIKARDGNGKEQEFNLADNCAIVIHGKWNDSLDHLMVSEEVAINYNNADGVLVANRVSPLSGPEPAAPAPTARNEEPNAGQLTTATH